VTLEAEVLLEILCHLADEALEGELAEEQLRGLLVAPDLTKRDGARTETVGLLDASHGRGGLACGACGELLAWGLASRGLACGLLGACHVRGLWWFADWLARLMLFDPCRRAISGEMSIRGCGPVQAWSRDLRSGRE